MLNPNYLHPRTKALAVCAFFIIAGVIGWYFAEAKSPDTWTIIPLLIFYATLTLNTYPSVKLFSSITHMEDMTQRLLDLLVVIAYLTLAYAFGNPLLFFMANLFIFILAPLKYIHLLGRIPHSRLLKRKITIDLLGTLLAACVLAGALLGYATYSAWALASIFAIANLYWLLLNPMYRVIDASDR
jgi:hypothetical protein